MLLSVAALAGCATTDADPVPAPAPTPGKAFSFTAAQYEAHIKALRTRFKKLGLSDLSVRVEDPFVVIGNGTPARLERDSGTVRWAADKLEQDFFAKRPAKILDIYLFADAKSYEHGVATLHGEAPDTPYGFYSPGDGALYMNIATGGGTLVHEIVHPYVQADFPSAPPWLNEGLGSLFEQSAERDGHIVGLTNWRLAGLHDAISADAVPSFKKLTGLDSAGFYGKGSGTHYAQARYLLYYMQEKGLLRDFYRAFRAARTKDPTGFATLAAALGEKDMAAFQARWEVYVAKLRFP
ncbi:MAG TPA: DUF1570 domain-containing protein [Kofleriaceae bacterium]